MKHEDTGNSYIDSLLSSKELNRMLFENAADAIFFVEKLKIVDCNQAACSMLGFLSKEEIIGRFLTDFSPEFQPDGILSKEKAQELIAPAIPGTTQKFYWNYLKSDKTLIDTEVTLNSFRCENRIIQQFAVHDIAFLKNIEKELSIAENKYKKLFENIQDVYYRIDLKGIITEISPSIERYSNYTQADIIGEPIDKFYYNPDDRARLISEIVNKGEAHDFEVLLKGKNNQLAWGSVNAHFIFDDSGQVFGIEGSIRDHSDRKQAEEKLRLSLSLLQATLDSTTDGILVVDRSGKITSYNKQFVLMYNLTDEILESGEDAKALEFVLTQFKDPAQFINKVHFLYDNPELESFDTLKLNDGRTLERFSCPQLLDGIPIGRVWSFRDITVRKKAEEQLHLMAHTLKSINESISITDINDRLLFVNAAFIKTYGHSEEELIGQDISIVRSPNNDTEVVNKIHDATAGSGWQGEIINRRKDGSDFPISLSTSVVKNEYGEILGMVGVASDITERKLSEKALQESEKKFRELIDNQEVGISVVDQDENFIFVNPAAEVIFGVPLGTLLHRNLRDFIVPDQVEKILQETEKRTKKEKSTYEVDIVTPDGRIVSLLLTATPKTDDDDRYIGTLGVYYDITDRKRAEGLLRKSEMKYRKLIETMPDGVYRSTHEGRFVEVNPAMVKMLGYESKEELLAIDIKNQLYFDPTDRESFVLQQKLEELGVFKLKKKDGTVIWVEDHGRYINDETGKVIFHEGIMRDITERKMDEIQLQKYSVELQELNSTKDKLFSIIAHDLKSPFNSITGLSEIIKNEVMHLDLATIEQYAGAIYSTSKQAYKLLENLLDWARIQQSQMSFQPVSIVLKEVVEEVIKLLDEKANSKKIDLINFVSGHIIVSADQDMLKTILRNLVSNALKFTSTNGKVEVQAISRPGEIEIAVKDTGTGIKKADLDELFKVGSNYSRRGTENENGTGLGLMLCKEFVEKHGGKIWVESEERKGSTFKFTLPI